MDESGGLGWVPRGLLALCGLGVTVLLFGDGLGWSGLAPPLPLDEASTAPVPHVLGVLALAGGTVAAARLAWRDSGTRLQLFGRIWLGVILTWSVVACLGAVVAPAAVAHIEVAARISGGALRGALLGWLVALPATLPYRPAEPVRGAGARSDPFLILSAVIWLPLATISLGLQFLSRAISPGTCPSLCESPRDWALLNLSYLSLGVGPTWWLQLAALAALRRTTGFRDRRVAGQVIIVLVCGVPIAAAVITYLATR